VVRLDTPRVKDDLVLFIRTDTDTDADTDIDTILVIRKEGLKLACAGGVVLCREKTDQ
jgi:hypothetical protein